MEMIVTTHNSMLLHIQKLLILKFLCCNFDKLMHQRNEKMKYFCG